MTSVCLTARRSEEAAYHSNYAHICGGDACPSMALMQLLLLMQSRLQVEGIVAERGSLDPLCMLQEFLLTA